MQCLDASCKSKSETLDLSGLGLDDRLLEPIVARLKNINGIRTLKINNNKITEAGLRQILRSIKDGKIEYFFMNENILKATALEFFMSFRKYNQTLKAVYLIANGLDKKSDAVRKSIRWLEENNIMVFV